MLQVILFFVFIILVATGFSWLSDQPGTILINFSGYERQFTPVEFVVTLSVLLGIVYATWFLVQQVVRIPGFISRFVKKRREKRGLEALSAGLIAVGIGDRETSARYSSQAKKTLPNEPLTALLRAQSAQLTGDRATARRIYEGMLGAPDTELLGLRGLFLEAQHEGEDEAAQQFAEQVVNINPRLQWAVMALFQFQCKKSDWSGALITLEVAKQYKHMERADANRKKAVLLTAQAIETEEDDMDDALARALEAHKIAPDLIPAANIAGRILASKGYSGKAAKVVSRTWKLSPHPDLALTYSHALTGSSPKDRLKRIQELATMKPDSMEGPIAVAQVCIEAKDWEAAREALENFVAGSPSARVCTLMARIEGEQGDQGRMREWLARAVRAPRDPVWTADGYTSDRWLPISPVSGRLDCFQWKVPVESLGESSQYEILPNDVINGKQHNAGASLSDDSNDGESERWEEDRKQDVQANTSETASINNSGEQAIVASSQTGKDLLPVPAETERNHKSTPAMNSTPVKQDQSKMNVYVAPRAPDDPGIDLTDQAIEVAAKTK